MTTQVLYASTFEHMVWEGPKRYVAIVVYDTLEEFRDACRVLDRRNMQKPDDKWKESIGAFFPAAVLDDGWWVVSDNKHFAGTIRLAKGHIHDVVVIHEVTHAALHIYRLDVRDVVNLGAGGSLKSHMNEEYLAHMVGDLGAEVAGTLAKAGLFK